MIQHEIIADNTFFLFLMSIWTISVLFVIRDIVFYFYSVLEIDVMMLVSVKVVKKNEKEWLLFFFLLTVMQMFFSCQC